VFEVCVGIFWPALGMMRGKYVPEASTCVPTVSVTDTMAKLLIA